jgi:hypothetical protein
METVLLQNGRAILEFYLVEIFMEVTFLRFF